LAICSANHGNQFQHPKPEIKSLLDELGIPVMTTKRGDVIISSEHPHRKFYKAFNLKAKSTEIQDENRFKSKKSALLGNPDRAQAHYNKPKNPFARFQ
jgi:competence protein ComEC